MLENKKAVIFDLDGSLVDSMWIWPEGDRGKKLYRDGTIFSGYIPQSYLHSG